MINQTVTIAIPTFNRSNYLIQAVNSVLQQTYNNVEIIVSDNASSDDTLSKLSAINDPRLHVLQQCKNIGMVNNWNACLNRASGDYFILLSDDDWLEPTAIQKMVATFELVTSPEVRNNEIGLICCRANTVNSLNNLIGRGRPAPYIESAEDLIASFFYGKRDMFPCKILFRTEDVRSVGGYPAELFPLSSDAYMWMMIVIRRGYAVFIDECLSNYRIHESSTTNNTKYDVWVKEATSLGSICCDLFKVKPAPDAVNRIKKAVTSWNCRLISGACIASSRFDKSRFTAIVNLFRHKDVFMTYKINMMILFLTVIKIVLPVSIVNTFRPIYNKLRHNI